MDDFVTIEKYVNGQLSPVEKAAFDDALRTDPALADALAFYLLTKQAAREEARQQRRAEFETLRHQLPDTAFEEETPVRPLWGGTSGRWIAAAASLVLLLGFGWYFVRFSSGLDGQTEIAQTTDLNTRVDQYITDNFSTLSPSMGGEADSLQTGVEYFNTDRLADAGRVFEGILQRQPDNDTALKYAGVVSLRLGNYDQAITQFRRLSQLDLSANPGLFYQALAYLKRGRPEDKREAKILLQRVIDENLDEKGAAELLIEQL
ncbi:hypothetical protein DYU11_31400 [Fibrisoma montanum]|uniref:Uncharacterized protein n=1 Tax=Fibrisoma montanum TaxID=2305895 RepID=A0A418LWA4_9BACT|nr:tetratricopeptide repeat protein [Fibrisoma montanum]RIV17555.1 hypothetical protein DYU11_31400 [Fibrisoma montanum]